VEPNFASMLSGAVVFAVPVLAFIWWRFGLPDMLVFIIVVGLFSAIMDFISSFVARNYEYPGQSPLWVFTYIFFGWMGMCGSCLFIAEGILANPSEDMLSQQGLWWRVPLLTAVLAVVFDLFIDPVAVAAGYWVWFKPGSIYYGIPLLNYVGWFVLMFFAPLAWILIVRKRQWASYRKIGIALGSLLPLFVASIVTSVLLNGVIAALGLE
jgi:Carotenoid biosynthesis protein